MELKEGYKQTEVGVIPEDWEVGCLGELFDFCNGFNADREQYGKGLPFISTLDVLRFCHIRHNDILGKVLVKQGIDTYLVKKGDVLFTRTSETQEEIGTASVYIGEEPVTFGGFVIRGRQKTPYFFEQYLGYAFKNPYVRKQITSLGQGGIHVNIGQSELEKVYVPIPHASEQKAIASALSDVDALLSSLDALIAKKRDIKSAAMQELLTGKKRLPGFSGEWVEKRLDAIGTFIKGRGISRSEAHSGPIPCIRYGEIYTHHTDIIKKFYSFISREVAQNAARLQLGDILFTCSGETKEDIGKSVAFTGSGEAYAGGDIIILRNTQECPEFLGYRLNAGDVSLQKSSAGQGDAVVHISATSLGAISVTLPQNTTEQAAIAAVLSDMDAEISALEARRAKVLALKQGMMQELLTGRTRLLPAGERHG